LSNCLRHSGSVGFVTVKSGFGHRRHGIRVQLRHGLLEALFNAFGGGGEVRLVGVGDRLPRLHRDHARATIGARPISSMYGVWRYH